MLISEDVIRDKSREIALILFQTDEHSSINKRYKNTLLY